MSDENEPTLSPDAGSGRWLRIVRFRDGTFETEDDLEQERQRQIAAGMNRRQRRALDAKRGRRKCDRSEP